MKKNLLTMAAIVLILCACGGKNPTEVEQPQQEGAAVYMTTDISPEGLVKVYQALGVQAGERVAVKISTGEAGGHNYLKPELIGSLVQSVNGHLVECNTTYSGQRRTTEQHLKVIEDHGFNAIGGVDIMDADGEMQIPVRDTTYMKFNLVGKNLQNYDFLINLAHFKGHQMGGFGGVLKNQSIGVASANGKAYIHSNGRNMVPEKWFQFAEPENQDKFLECMATAATAVSDYMKGQVVYINVMNNMSIDCDCNGNPKAPELKDMGILASTDPVALDQACLDLVYAHQNAQGDDATSLIQRIEKQHGVHIIEHAEKIGLGTRKYHIINIE